MKVTSFAQNFHDLNLLKDQGLDEIILGHKDFSRFGKLGDDEFAAIALRSRELGLKVIFEWDILMTQNVFELATLNISKHLSLVNSLRVQDPGALKWSLEQTNLPLQFIAENGNHNLEALIGWRDLCQGRLERLILSLELSKESIKDYVTHLNVPCELLGLGRILLFYTPRALLTPLSPEKIALNGELSVLGASEESPHKGFPILENKHGTFMFHIKEFCLLEFAGDLRDMGLAYIRIDLRWEGMNLFSQANSLIKDFKIERFLEFKQEFPQDLMRGFYLVNKTDVLFPKLKNNRLQQREGNYIGEVMEAEKGSHLAIMVRNSRGLKSSDKIKILHPKGEIFELPIYALKNIDFEDVTEIPSQTLAIIPYVGGVWVKSQVFIQS